MPKIHETPAYDLSKIENEPVRGAGNRVLKNLPDLYTGVLTTKTPPLRSEPPDFCPGFQCFQISVFESSRRDFIDSQISKILSRDFIVS